MTAITDTSPTSSAAFSNAVWLTVARAVWVALTLLSIVTLVLSLGYAVSTGVNALSQRRIDGLAELGMAPEFYLGFHFALTVVMSLVFFGVGALIFVRKSAEKGVLLFSLFLMVFGGAVAVAYHPAYLSLLDPSVVLPESAAFLPYLLWITQSIGWFMLGVFMLVFPDGRLRPRISVLQLAALT